MTTPYIAPILVQNGFIGVTGTTPYRPSTTSQVSTLQNQYANALAGQAISRATGAIHINLNFDGTQNNREFVPEGEFQTNVASLYGLQRDTPNKDNTFYFSGIGAQTVLSGTLLPNGSVPQRLPAITWRESRQGDPGYAVLDINPLTGEQRSPYLRFDDRERVSCYQSRSCLRPINKGCSPVSYLKKPCKAVNDCNWRKAA